MDKQYEVLKYEAENLKSALRDLHQSDTSTLVYPRYTKIESAIYDVDGNYIFGTLDAKHGFEEEEADKLYYRAKLEPYYLGAGYLLLSKDIDEESIAGLQKQILLFMLAAAIFFSLLGYFLGRLFVSPMRQALEKMNQFIQDTTHELNTPISTILTNIEMIETFGKDQENRVELKRIAIASKTLSHIYDDLTYLNLNHDYHRDLVEVDMSALMNERILYFTAMADAKALDIQVDVVQNIVLKIDKNDALRLVDNLLSNAIKYNKHEGILALSLTQDNLSVRDTGIGIKSKELQQISQRYKRANSAEGGFGIGLHIVAQVCENYGYTLNIESEENKGTEVSVRWVK